jgi:tripartite-type tricarboxylate transporter receptor subunit TctC
MMRSMKSAHLMTFGVLFVISILIGIPTVIFGADTYPSKTVRIIVAEAPGGGTDIVGRLIATKLSERLGRQVIVENHGGAGGIIGTEMVAKANPDGYTLIVDAARFVIQPALQKLPYDPIKSFMPIAHLASGPQVLAIHPSVPANSVKELIALVKQKPGQLIFAATGAGTTSHMTTELFKMLADIDFKIVQFKGAGPAMVDLLGGHSSAQFSALAGFLPHIKSGKLRVLGTGGAKRSVVQPDLPTIAESGLPGFKATSWYGFLAPAATPKPIIDRLNDETKAILAMDDVKKQILNNGMEVDYLGPTDFGTFIEKEVARWTSVVKKANIRLEE